MIHVKLCFVLFLLAWVSVSEAQTTKVRGKVVDAETGEGGADAVGEYHIRGYHDRGDN